MNSKKILASVIAVLFAVFMVACGDSKPKEEVASQATATVDPEIAKGEEIFLQNCSSCHGEKVLVMELQPLHSIQNLETSKLLQMSGRMETHLLESLKL